MFPLICELQIILKYKKITEYDYSHHCSKAFNWALKCELITQWNNCTDCNILVCITSPFVTQVLPVPWVSLILVNIR